MTTLYQIAQARWFGPLILVLGSLLLPVVVQGSELLLVLAVAGVFVALVSIRVQHRWLVALPAVFIVGLLAFNIHAGILGITALSFVLVFGIGTALVLWLLPTQSAADIVLAYAGGIGLLEVFLVLLFWPVNFVSRSLILTAAALLVFELLGQRSGNSSAASLLGSVGLAALALLTVIVTADWQSF